LERRKGTKKFEITFYLLLEAKKCRWRKALAIGLAGLGMAAATMTGKAAGSEEQWDASLNQLWHQLSPKQRQELKQDQREWISWKEKLPDDVRYRALQARAGYLELITQGVNPTAAMNSEIADALKWVEDILAELTPDQQQETGADTQNQIDESNQLTSYKKVAALDTLARRLADIRDQSPERQAHRKAIMALTDQGYKAGNTAPKTQNPDLAAAQAAKDAGMTNEDTGEGISQRDLFINNWSMGYRDAHGG
jgi:hypothetical protein